MSYLVLARKWRPQTFDDIVGQQTITRTLQNAIRQDRVAHAFLFAGPRGVGKTTMARVLAKALNCDTGPTDSPCDKCGPCNEITIGNSVDVLEIDGASNRGIDNIRELRETVKYMPTGSRYKIYVIDEVHMLTTEAFNALLKTLEEPPPHVVFIFATTEAHKVPVTIHSRCQRYDFKRIALTDILDRLIKIVDSENLPLKQKDLKLIAREAEGSMRDALSLLDQVISFAGEAAGDQDVTQILGIVDREYLFNISKATIDHDARATLEIIEELDRYGCDFKNFSSDLLAHFRNLAVTALTDNPERLMDLTEDEIQQLKQQTEKTTPETLQMLFDILAASEQDLIRSEQPRWILEMTLAKMALLRPITPLGAILKKIKQMEKDLSAGIQPSSAPSQPVQPLFNGAPEPTKTEQEIQAPNAGADRSWEDFLGMVEGRDFKLHSYLAQATYKTIQDKQIQVFAHDAFAHQKLTDEKISEAVNRMLGEYMGPGYNLKVMEKEVDNQSPQAVNMLNEKEKLRQDALADPTVKAITDILEGNIKEIKIK